MKKLTLLDTTLKRLHNITQHMRATLKWNAQQTCKQIRTEGDTNVQDVPENDKVVFSMKNDHFHLKYHDVALQAGKHTRWSAEMQASINVDKWMWIDCTPFF